MQGPLRYLAFGLLVLAGYWFTLQRGIVYFGGSAAPSQPSARAGGLGAHRSRPTFWSTGYQGGK